MIVRLRHDRYFRVMLMKIFSLSPYKIVRRMDSNASIVIYCWICDSVWYLINMEDLM